MDCGSGLRCDDGRCVAVSPLCEAPNQPCGGVECAGDALQIEICDDALECVPTRVQCPAGTACEDGLCAPDPSGFTCDFEGQSCAQPPRCDGDAQVVVQCAFGADDRLACAATQRACRDGETCREGRCTPDGACFAEGQTCGEARCVGGDAVRFVCDADLRCRPRSASCTGGRTCLRGACVEAACEVAADCGRPVCEDIRFFSDPRCFDGVCSTTSDPCPDGTVCQGGRCGPLQVVEQCRIEGEPCGSGSCDFDVAVGFTCQRDAPDGPLECRETRAPCARGQTCRDGFCVLDDGFCINDEDPCGDDICVGDTAVRFECDDDRRCQPFADPCAPDELCRGGRCRSPGFGECPAAGARCQVDFCDGNVRVLGRCDDDLVCVEERLPCGDDQVCDGGRCFQLSPGRACAAFGDRCAEPQCRGDTLIDFRCGPDLRCRRFEQPCGGDQVCVGGACRPGTPCAVPGAPCGEVACAGPAALARPTCSDDLICVDREIPCGSGGRCEGGVCLPVSEECAAAQQLCGPIVCDGNAISLGICDADLICRTELAPCPPGTSCDGGGCVLDPSTFECAVVGQPCPSLPACVGNSEVDVVCGRDPQGGLTCGEQLVPCGPDEECREGVCVPDIPCFVPEQRCGDPICRGVFQVDFVCDDALQCRPRRTECDGDEVCNGGRCLTAECRVDDDCDPPACLDARTPVEFDCRQGQCEPDDGRCDEGTVCSVGRCIEDEVSDPCESAGQDCGAPLCAGAVGTRFVCLPDGADGFECVAVQNACTGGEVCREGFCVDDGEFCAEQGEPCGPPRCQGDEVVTFACDGNGRCLPRSERCPDTCRGGVCVVDPPLCPVANAPCGAPFCLDDSLLASPTCDADLQCVDVTRPCPDGQSCLGDRCTVLTPECGAAGETCNAPFCRDGVRIAATCDAGLDCVEAAAPCPEGTFCQGGECRPLDAEDACRRPGDSCRPTACDTVISRACDDAGRCQEVRTPCAAEAVCDAGVCVPRSGRCLAADAPCDVPVCAGDDIRVFTCDAELQCVERVEPCPAGNVCEAGICTPAGNGGACACTTPGATVGPAPPGCDFIDNRECSGWASVILGAEGAEFTADAQQAAAAREVDDGTVFCAFGCCMRIGCP